MMAETPRKVPPPPPTGPSMSVHVDRPSWLGRLFKRKPKPTPEPYPREWAGPVTLDGIKTAMRDRYRVLTGPPFHWADYTVTCPCGWSIGTINWRNLDPSLRFHYDHCDQARIVITITETPST